MFSCSIFFQVIFGLLWLSFPLLATLSLPPDTEEQMISVEEGELFCRLMGKGEALLVIHGGPGLSQEYLLPHLAKLASHYQLIFYDQRGCGQSRGPVSRETIDLSHFVKDIERVRLALGKKQISILGHSWGGFLAMNYAVAYPQSIKKLILSNTLPFNSTGISLFLKELGRRVAPFQKELKEIELSDRFRLGDPVEVRDYFRKLFQVYCGDPQKVYELQLEAPAEVNLRGRQVNQILCETLFAHPIDLSVSLKELSCPTLILHGNLDPIPLSTAQALQPLIKNSFFQLIDASGHFPYVEQPFSFFEAVHSFLDRDGSSSL